MSALTPPARLPHSLAPLAERAAELGRAAKAPRTLAAYRADWQAFVAWCQDRGLGFLPAEPQTLGLYIADRSRGIAQLNPRSLERAIAGILYRHRLEGHALDRRHSAIAEVLAGAKREKPNPLRQALPLTAPRLKRLLEACGQDIVGIRDRALLLTGFYGALRRSELVGIDLEHLQEEGGGYRLVIPRSKTDQEGEGALVGLPRAGEESLCPVLALEAWLRHADIDGGPVFRGIDRWGRVSLYRLSERAVNLILKSLAKSAGFSKAEIAGISGHSLRAGHITQAYEKNVAEAQIQSQARHRNPASTRRYNRAATLFSQSSAKGLLE